MTGNAIFSSCGLYRYSLSRSWHESGPRDLWIMLNPSRANAERDDMTIKKCIGFSQSFGSAGFDVINLMAMVATCPLDLSLKNDPIGVENDYHTMLYALTRPARVICAWGTEPRFISHLVAARRIQTLGILQKYGVDLQTELWCLGKTKSGQPRHPSRLAYSTPLERLA